MDKKLSIHDIAKNLKVSAATVSYVLNGKAREKRISRGLENRIKKYANQQGYRINSLAKSLRTGKSNVIAMLVEGIDDPFFSSIARVIEANANQMGYKIFYASTENDPELTKELINKFQDAQVDGYIIAPPEGIENDVKSLMKAGYPLVLFDRYFPEQKTYNVVVDNFDGTYRAMRHFLKHGYQNIGFVTLSSVQIQMEDRLDGYLQAVNEEGLQTFIQRIPFEWRVDQSKIREIIKNFLTKHKQLDAILFATNYLAISGLEAIDVLNLEIPDDIAVIGFDDISLFSLFKPGITAIAQPIREISEQVVSQLMLDLNGNGKSTEKKTIKLPTELIVRESSIPVVR